MPGRLNEAQRLAAAHGEGPMLVLAGPGSGKTFTITKRIAHLIRERRVAEDRILVITFTREAARSMQKRYRESCGASLVCFGTFHSVFYQILRESCAGAREHILKNSDKRSILLPLIRTQLIKAGLPGGQDTADAADRLLAAFGFFKNTRDAEKAAGQLEEPWKQLFPALFGAYEEERRLRRGLDFDDMVYDCLLLFETRPEILGRWRKRFQYLLIDEFQDINPVQYQAVRLLAAPLNNVFAVGDDDQSIYSFRGSDPSLMRRFLEDYPSAGKVLLDTNYRSAPLIVEASLKVIGQNKERFEKTLKAAGGGTKPGGETADEAAVRLRAFSSRDEQYDYLAERLREERMKGGLEGCAVLCRTNAGVQAAAARLSRAGIAFHVKEKQTCIYDHFIAKDVEAYVRLAMGERRRALFLRILEKPWRGLNRDAFREDPVSLRALRAYEERHAPQEASETVLRAVDRLESDIGRMGRLKPALGMQYLRRGMGYEGYLLKRAGKDRQRFEEWLGILEWLTADAGRYGGYWEWLDGQQEFREQWERDVESGKRARPGIHQETGSRQSGGSGQETGEGHVTDAGAQTVEIMTAHASKGLEFARVFLPDVNEGAYPHGRGALPRETVEEECRMLYVAMTRAKEALELLYVTGAKERPALPSRFIRILQQENYSFSPESSTISSNSQVSRYSSNASATFSYSSSSSMKSSLGSSLGSSGFSL